MLQWVIDSLAERSIAGSSLLVFGMLVLCGLGMPMPEDVVLVTAGVLAWLGSRVEATTIAGMLRDPVLWTMVVVSYLGIIVGDSLTFWAGRRYGSHLAEHNLLRRIVTPQKVEKVETLMRRWGTVAVFVARYLPGLRAPMYFTAGHARLPYWKFALFDGAAGIISAPLWVCVGYYFGDDIGQAMQHGKQVSRYLLMGALVVVGMLVCTIWWRSRRESE